MFKPQKRDKANQAESEVEASGDLAVAVETKSDAIADFHLGQ
jgi:hypothetical protein